MTTGRSLTAIDARCAGWRKESYSAEGKNEPERHGDTSRTIIQIRQHNQTGVNKGCWK